MKKISIILCLIFAIGIFSQSCEKEKIVQNNINSEHSDFTKGEKPSLTQLAAILGIDVECIVKVEHRSGLYHCKDETIQKPDGTTIKSHEFWCEPPFYADCCTVVYVKARTKSEDCTNGYVALKRDKNQQIESIFMIYDTDLLNNAKWLKDGMVILENEHPLVNSSDLGLCKDNEYVSLPSGLYRLSSFGPFQYFEIKVSNLKFNEGILIEQ